MYIYVLGEDDHFVFKQCKNRQEAEKDLIKALMVYHMCYQKGTSEHGILTNSEFEEKFPNEEYINSISYKRFGNKLREKIDDYKKWRDESAK